MRIRNISNNSGETLAKVDTIAFVMAKVRNVLVYPLIDLPHDGYRVCLEGAKRPEQGVDHPFPSSSEVKERLELYLYSPSGLSWYLLG